MWRLVVLGPNSYYYYYYYYIIYIDDLRTILRKFLDLRQTYKNWQIHRTFTTIVRPILRQHLMIGF